MQTYTSEFYFSETERQRLSTKELEELRTFLMDDDEITPHFGVAKPMVVNGLLTAQAAKDDVQEFSFGIKLISINGSLSKSGRLEFRVSAFGIEIERRVFDFGKGEFETSITIGINKIGSLTLGFEFKNSCLRTTGKFKGWFKTRASWNQKLLCF